MAWSQRCLDRAVAYTGVSVYVPTIVSFLIASSEQQSQAASGYTDSCHASYILIHIISYLHNITKDRRYLARNGGYAAAVQACLS